MFAAILSRSRALESRIDQIEGDRENETEKERRSECEEYRDDACLRSATPRHGVQGSRCGHNRKEADRHGERTDRPSKQPANGRAAGRCHGRGGQGGKDCGHADEDAQACEPFGVKSYSAGFKLLESQSTFSDHRNDPDNTAACQLATSQRDSHAEVERARACPEAEGCARRTQIPSRSEATAWTSCDPKPGLAAKCARRTVEQLSAAGAGVRDHAWTIPSPDSAYTLTPVRDPAARRRRFAYPIVTLCVAGIIFLFSQGKLALEPPVAPAAYEAFAREVVDDVRAGRPIRQASHPSLERSFSLFVPESIRRADGGAVTVALLDEGSEGSAQLADPFARVVEVRATDGGTCYLIVRFEGGVGQLTGVVRQPTAEEGGADEVGSGGVAQ